MYCDLSRLRIERQVGSFASSDYLSCEESSVHVPVFAEGINMNPYSLAWDVRLGVNPNLEEAARDRKPLCVALSPQGLRYRRCESGVNLVICGKGMCHNSVL